MSIFDSVAAVAFIHPLRFPLNGGQVFTFYPSPNEDCNGELLYTVTEREGGPGRFGSPWTKHTHLLDEADFLEMLWDVCRASILQGRGLPVSLSVSV